ncbi:MAG: hypothetical protein QNK04_03140 [Myxococcota bacterium]|nr:hypothetical protein [Myxococcota bacterium]
MAAALAILVLLPLGHASGQVLQEEVPLTDVLEVFLLDRDLVAMDAASGGQRTLRLRLDETVLWMGSQGRVGVAFTDQRALAVAVGSAAWQQEEWLLTEARPQRALLGDRVALFVTNRRVLGFTTSGNLIERSLGLRERVLAIRTGENVGVLVSDRRALGMSPGAGGFFEISIQLEERIEAVEAVSNMATVTSNRRVLIFRGPFGSWAERRRELR